MSEKYDLFPENDLPPEKYEVSGDLPDTDINAAWGAAEIPDKIYSLVSNAVGNSNLTAEIRSAVSAASAEFLPAAYTYQKNYPESENENNYGKKYDLRDIISEINKPVQIILDGDTIGKAVIKYENELRKISNT